jgi:predicted nucleic acid-binding protein
VKVIDACVVVDYIAPGEQPLSAREFFANAIKPGDSLVAPGLLWLEARNVLLTGVRRRLWTGAEADEAVANLVNLPVQRLDSPADEARAYELARRYDNCPAYDMVYVALAERLGSQLYTTDIKLSKRLAHLGWVHGITKA